MVAAFSTVTHSILWVTLPGALLGQLFVGLHGVTGWLRALLIVLLFGVIAMYFVVNTNYVVIATDQRTIVGRAGKVVTSKMHSIETIVPPHIRIRSSRGIIYSTVESLGPKMRFHVYFDSEVLAADARPVVAPER